MAKDPNRELKILREQMASDFNFTVQALGGLSGEVRAVSNQFRILNDQVQTMAVNFDETTRQLQGRMRLIEERFSKFIGIIEGDVTDLRSSVRDLDTRVTRLEKGKPPAA